MGVSARKGMIICRNGKMFTEVFVHIYNLTIKEVISRIINEL